VSQRKLFELAHEVGGGFGGFLDFGETVDARAGAVEILGEDIGIGGDDTKEIIQGMGDDLGFGGRQGRRVGDIEGQLHRCSLSGMGLGLLLG